jgi:hypothetical protein
LPEPVETLADPLCRRPAGRRSRADDDVGGGQLVLGEPERFADYATKPVAGDCISDEFGTHR